MQSNAQKIKFSVNVTESHLLKKALTKNLHFLCSGIHEQRTDSVSSVTYMLGNFDFEFTEEAKGTFYQIHNLKSLMNEPECCMNQKI